MTTSFDSDPWLIEKLKTYELYPKVKEMLDYVISNSLTEFEDVKYKYRGPQIVKTKVIQEIIEELGFGYINGIINTIDNFEFNVLLDFIGLLNLLKGSRLGLELVLKLLSLDSVVQEWWEQSPLGVPDTYVITVIMDGSTVPDPSATLEKVQAFAKEYVYPVISNIDFRFTFSFAEKNVNFAGFIKQNAYTQTGGIIGTVFPLT